MTQTRTTTKDPFKKIVRLYNRALEYNLYYAYEERMSRSLEAFSMLTILMERVLKEFGLSSLKKREDLSKLYEQRRQRNNRYDIRDAINDVYLLGEISDKEFVSLKEFQKDRNDYIHNIFAKPDEKIEEYAYSLFEKHKSAFVLIIKKLRKSLPV